MVKRGHFIGFIVEHLLLKSYGHLACIWLDGYPWMEYGHLWTGVVCFMDERNMDIPDREIFLPPKIARRAHPYLLIFVKSN